MKRLQNDPELIHCYRCGAYYRPGVWLFGQLAEGTAGQFLVRGTVRQNECVICRKPPRLTPYALPASPVHLIGKDGSVGNFHPAPVTASIDAALALCERKVPGWWVQVNTDGIAALQRRLGGNQPAPTFRGYAPTAPLAILIALLEALIGKET